MSRNYIDWYYDYGIYMPTKSLYMGSEGSHDGAETGTDFLMTERVLKGLHVLDRSTTQGITIIMNNIGGDDYHGLAIYDAIQSCENHVTIKVFGHAMSMGAVILQAADTRIMAPHSRFMMHYGSLGIEDHTKTVEKWAEESKKTNDWMEEVFIEKIREKKPRYARAKLRELLKFDTILTAQETVDLGLANKILGE